MPPLARTRRSPATSQTAGRSDSRPALDRLCPPASRPCTIRALAPRAIAARASATLPIWIQILQPAAIRRAIQSAGASSQKKTTTGTRCSTSTSICSDMLKRVMMFTPNGRFVARRMSLICARRTSGLIAAIPIMPKPPASHTAVASGAVATNAMPAFTKGSSSLYSSVSRVFRTTGRPGLAPPWPPADIAAMVILP